MFHTSRHRFPRRHALLSLLLPAALLLPSGGCKRKGAKAFNQGQGHLKKKQYAQAISSFENAIQQNPEFGEAHYNLGAACFQLAANKLKALVERIGSPDLKAALRADLSKPTESKLRRPLGPPTVKTLVLELGGLPPLETEPIVGLVRKALAAKLKARALFKKGKFLVVRKSSTRLAMIGKLEQVEKMRRVLVKSPKLYPGWWLLAVARPSLVEQLVAPSPRPRPRPQGASKP